MPDTDSEATERAEADLMGLEVLDMVDVGGTWTVIGDGDTAPPAPPEPAAPTTPSQLAKRPPAPPPAPIPVAPAPPVVVARPVVKAHRATSGRSGGGRWLIAAAIVAGLAVAVPLAVGAGTFMYRVTNAPAPRAASDPGRYLAGASSTRVEAAALSRGLQCGTPPQDVGLGTALVRVCQHVSGRRIATVAMGGRDPGHLIVVTASVGGEPADDPTDLALLRAITNATVAGRDVASDDAWLSAHFDQSGDSQAVVNGVLLRLTVHDPVRSLSIVRAPA